MRIKAYFKLFISWTISHFKNCFVVFLNGQGLSRLSILLISIIQPCFNIFDPNFPFGGRDLTRMFKYNQETRDALNTSLPECINNYVKEGFCCFFFFVGGLDILILTV